MPERIHRLDRFSRSPRTRPSDIAAWAREIAPQLRDARADWITVLEINLGSDLEDLEFWRAVTREVPAACAEIGHEIGIAIRIRDDTTTRPQDVPDLVALRPEAELDEAMYAWAGRDCRITWGKHIKRWLGEWRDDGDDGMGLYLHRRRHVPIPYTRDSASTDHDDEIEYRSSHVHLDIRRTAYLWITYCLRYARELDVAIQSHRGVGVYLAAKWGVWETAVPPDGPCYLEQAGLTDATSSPGILGYYLPGEYSHWLRHEIEMASNMGWTPLIQRAWRRHPGGMDAYIPRSSYTDVRGVRL